MEELPNRSYNLSDASSTFPSLYYHHLCIDEIYHVVDPGFVKQKVYNSKSVDALVVTPIYQARKRFGHAAWVHQQLYTEKAYGDEMLLNTISEIQHTNLASTVLSLKAMGINSLL